MLTSMAKSERKLPGTTVCVFNHRNVMACRSTAAGGPFLTISTGVLRPMVTDWAWDASVAHSVRAAIEDVGAPRGRVATAIPLTRCKWWSPAVPADNSVHQVEAAMAIARSFAVDPQELILDELRSRPDDPTIWIGCERRTVEALVGDLTSLRIRVMRLDAIELAMARAASQLLEGVMPETGYVLCVPSQHGTSIVLANPAGSIMGLRWVPLAEPCEANSLLWAESVNFELGMLRLYRATFGGGTTNISLVCVHEDEAFPWCKAQTLESVAQIPCMTTNSVASSITNTSLSEAWVDAGLLLACIGLLDRSVPIQTRRGQMEALSASPRIEEAS